MRRAVSYLAGAGKLRRGRGREADKTCETLHGDTRSHRQFTFPRPGEANVSILMPQGRGNILVPIRVLNIHSSLCRQANRRRSIIASNMRSWARQGSDSTEPWRAQLRVFSMQTD